MEKTVEHCTQYAPFAFFKQCSIGFERVYIKTINRIGCIVLDSIEREMETLRVLFSAAKCKTIKQSIIIVVKINGSGGGAAMAKQNNINNKIDILIE